MFELNRASPFVIDAIFLKSWVLQTIDLWQKWEFEGLKIDLGKSSLVSVQNLSSKFQFNISKSCYDLHLIEPAKLCPLSDAIKRYPPDGRWLRKNLWYDLRLSSIAQARSRISIGLLTGCFIPNSRTGISPFLQRPQAS